jgi:hypothetical protein
MEHMHRINPKPCRCALVRMAFEGTSWPTMSIEHLRDRLTETEVVPR